MKDRALARLDPWELSSRKPTRLCFRRDRRRSIVDSKGRAIEFHDELDVELQLQEDIDATFTCRLPSLDVNERGASQELARAAAADAIRIETALLLHTMSHLLDEQQLARKGLLLGAVDVVASRIAEPIGEFTWVPGRIEMDKRGQSWFREARTDGAVFPIDPGICVPNDAFLRMAKLRMDDAGEPTGSVLEFEEPLDDDPDATWEEWKRLTSHDD